MSTATATEHVVLMEMARGIAERELSPRAAVLDRGEPGAMADCWRHLSEVGLDRALLDDEHGGSGLEAIELLAAIEELARGDGGVALSVLLSNAALTALGAERAAAIAQGARWVFVPVRSGTEVTIRGEQIDGRVMSALGAYGADGIVLALDGPHPDSIALAAGTPGLELERDEAQLGLCAAPAASIRFMAIDARSAGGTASAGGTEDPTGALSLLRAGTAAIARGIASRAYEMALDYARARQQGGVRIIEHHAVSDMLVAMAERLRAPLTPTLGPADALAAKISATDAAVATTTDAVQIFGGTGYMSETGIEKLMRDAKFCQLFPEPNWVARHELMGLEQAGRR
ncbi:MAG: acyl-CoA dehydrogenase family protein [Solirubrobacteraceae bacterium]